MDTRSINGIILVLFTVFYSGTICSQSIEVNPAGNPLSDLNAAELVRQVLLASGGITFDPASLIVTESPDEPENPEKRSWGYFRKGTSTFPFEEGIILSTGSAKEAEGPNDNVGFTSFVTGIWPGDNDLETILNTVNGDVIATNNATIFQFDFIPDGNTLKFDFIFGSEEYENDYECDNNFRDGFAFLIKGPGLPNDSGTAFGGQNIAAVPGSDNIIVNTGSIHDNSFSCGTEELDVNFFPELYISNSGVNNNGVLQFDGYTDILFTETEVIAGETYTIKITIADRGDTQLDSAVFIRGFAVNSNVVIVDEEGSELNFFLCQGEDEILTAQFVDDPFTGSETYEWQLDGVIIAGETSATITVTQSGIYKVIVRDDGREYTDSIRVTVIPSPDAGDPGILDICSSDDPVDLFTGLEGTPTTGGVWSPALTSGNGIFDPANDTAGIYTYTVTSDNDCGTDQASVTITVTEGLQAGEDGILDSCTTTGTTDLFAQLGGVPDVGGTWAPALTSGTGVFDPTTDAAGIYTYTVTSANGCGTDSATVTVTISPILQAGEDGILDSCTDDGTTDLFTHLGGTPDTGGSWAPALTNGNGIFDPATDVAGIYTYTVTSANGCGTDSATIAVRLISPPEITIVSKNCTDTTYEIIFATDIESIIGVSAGEIDNDTFRIFNIPQGTDIEITASSNIVSTCVAILTVEAPECSCPEIVMPDPTPICVDQSGSPLPGSNFPVINTNLDPNKYTFTWSYEGIEMSGETSPSITATKAGNYKVIYTDILSGCIGEASVTVIINEGSERLVLELSNGIFSQNNGITATVIGGGSYEYALDGGAYQQDNRFENVSLGIHEVNALSTNGCGSISENIFVLGFPNFFTPNNDGYNDFWNVIADFDVPDMDIFIFDRYGKLLAKLDPNSPGWDGIYNGSILPSTDYWFTAKMKDGSASYRSHFTLKR